MFLLHRYGAHCKRLVVNGLWLACLLLGCAGQVCADLSDPELAELLKSFLTTDDDAVRKEALAKLVSVGPAGVPRLESALADGALYGPQPTGVLHQKFRLTFNNTDIE